MYDFLSRLITDSGTRAAFDADPRRCLDEAGFTDLPMPEFVHAASFLLDFAPVDVVDSRLQALGPRVSTIVGNSADHAALPLLVPYPRSGQHDTELNMPTPEIFSSLGDVDEMLRPAEASNTENSSTEDSHSQDVSGSMNPILSGNELQFDHLVGDLNTAGVAGDLNGASQSGDVNAGNVAGNGVSDVVGGVHDPVGADLDQVGGLSEVTDLGDVAPEISGADPLGGAHLSPDTGATAPIAGAEDPLGAEETSGPLADLGDLGL
ncbi:hypothetical protein REH65_14020 [Saccharopolyspora sp. ID03-671]|uniref:hypothetical protein n=1 Tax=Saccharopolyspora sp. ID03-671 TaxID=3073066 RepID=UPI003253B4C5